MSLTKQFGTGLGRTGRKEKDIDSEQWTRVKKLGSGRFGEVYLERNTRGQLRAVKSLTKSKAKYDQALQEWLQKAVIPKDNVGVVKLYGWFENVHFVYIAMEYFQYGNLDKWLHATNQSLPEHEAQSICLQLAEALRILHSNDFIHGCVRPNKIFIREQSPNWLVKLGGFHGSVVEDTVPDHLPGYDPFQAPELMNILCDESVGDQATAASDVWALGCVTFWLLSLKHPFDQETLRAYCLEGNSEDCELSNAIMNDRARKFFFCCLNPLPRDRPLADEVEELLWLEGSAGFPLRRKVKQGWSGHRGINSLEVEDKLLLKLPPTVMSGRALRRPESGTDSITTTADENEGIAVARNEDPFSSTHAGRQFLVDEDVIEQLRSNPAQMRLHAKRFDPIISQGKAVRIFTLVTIFFLPLSFFVGFFGMNVRRVYKPTSIHSPPNNLESYCTLALSLFSFLGILYYFPSLVRKGGERAKSKLGGQTMGKLKSPSSIHRVFSGKHLNPMVVRMNWVCNCGYRAHDDFYTTNPNSVKSLAEELIQSGMLRKADVTDTTSSMLSSGLSELRNAFNVVSNALTSPFTGRAQSQLPTINSTPSSGASTLYELQSNTTSALWLLSCIDEKYAPSLHHVNVCDVSKDFDLFHMMRTHYYRARKNMSLFQKLFKRLGGIDFIKFELFPKNKVNVSQRHCVPKPPHTKDYVFTHSESSPPIGRQILAHFFHHPEHCTASTICYSHIPKKVQDRLLFVDTPNNVGWGLHFVEQTNSFVVMVLLLIGTLASAGVFALSYRLLGDDIQSAGTIASWITAIFAMIIATIAALGWQNL